MENQYPAYINAVPRSFTEQGRQRAIQVVESAILIGAAKPKVIFRPEDAAFVSGPMVALRKKDWKSSKPMGLRSEPTGIVGELAYSRFFNEPAEQVIQAFDENLAGDPGFDSVVNGYRVDAKATQNADKIFSFSRKVATGGSPAHLFTFASVSYQSHGAVTVTLEGWAWAAEVIPWIRTQTFGTNGESHKVRLWVLRREGVLHALESFPMERI